MQRRVDELYRDDTFNEPMPRGLEYPLEEFKSHMGKFYEAGESFWLRDLEKIYLMRLALASGVDGPQPRRPLLAELQPEYCDDGFLSKYVQADGLESFEGRFGVEVMLGIANDDMDISDLMAPYVKETLAGVAAKEKAAAKKPKAAAAGSSSQGRGRGGADARARGAGGGSQGGAKKRKAGRPSRPHPRRRQLLDRRRRRRR